MSLDHANGAVLLTVTGDLDLAAEELWGARIAEACALAPAHVVLDLAGVTFIDSSGLRLLIVGKNITDDAGIALRLANIPRAVARVFDMTGLLSQFESD